MTIDFLLDKIGNRAAVRLGVLKQKSARGLPRQQEFAAPAKRLRQGYVGSDQGRQRRDCEQACKNQNTDFTRGEFL